MNCKHRKPLLGKILVGTIYPDEEPYKSGQYKSVDPIDVNIQAHVRYCERCGKVLEMWVEDD